MLRGLGRWGIPLTAVVAGLAIWVCLRTRAYRTLTIVGGAVVLVYAYPVLPDLPRLLTLAGLVSWLWLWPGLALGAMVPWLRQPSGYPKLWGGIAVLAACLLVVATYFVHWFVVLAVVFLLAGVFFLRGAEIERYYSIIALSIAVNIFGLTHLVQKAQFFNIQQESYLLSMTAPKPFFPDVVKRLRGKQGAQIRKAMESIQSEVESWTIGRDPVTGEPRYFTGRFARSWTELSNRNEKLAQLESRITTYSDYTNDAERETPVLRRSFDGIKGLREYDLRRKLPEIQDEVNKLSKGLQSVLKSIKDDRSNEALLKGPLPLPPAPPTPILQQQTGNC